MLQLVYSYNLYKLFSHSEACVRIGLNTRPQPMTGETGFWTQCLQQNVTHHQLIQATTRLRQTSRTRTVSQEAYRAKRNL
jgi:hypothetical protein